MDYTNAWDIYLQDYLYYMGWYLMKKIRKPIIAMFLTITLLLSLSIVSYAARDSDPIGYSIPVPTQNVAR